MHNSEYTRDKRKWWQDMWYKTTWLSHTIC